MDRNGGLPSLTAMSRFPIAAATSDANESGKSAPSSRSRSVSPVSSLRALPISRAPKSMGVDAANRKVRKRKGGAGRFRLDTRAPKRSRVETISSKVPSSRELVAGAAEDRNQNKSLSANYPVSGVLCTPNAPNALAASANVFARNGALNMVLSPQAEGLHLIYREGNFPSELESQDFRCSGSVGRSLFTETGNQRAQLTNGNLEPSLVGSPSQEKSKLESGGEQRVLRPRSTLQPDGKKVKYTRNLKDVSLCLADAGRIIGRRIKVYWPLDEKWYFGVVKAYDAVRKLHRIVYDDHDEEWLGLRKEKFKLQVFPGEFLGQSIVAKNSSSSVPEKVSLGADRKAEEEEGDLSERQTEINEEHQERAISQEDTFLAQDAFLDSFVPPIEDGNPPSRLKQLNSVTIATDEETDSLLRQNMSPASMSQCNCDEPVSNGAVNHANGFVHVGQGGSSITVETESQKLRNKEGCDGRGESSGIFAGLDVSNESDLSTTKGSLQSPTECGCTRVYVRRHSRRRLESKPDGVETVHATHREESSRSTENLQLEQNTIQNTAGCLQEPGLLEKSFHIEELLACTAGPHMKRIVGDGDKKMDASPYCNLPSENAGQQLGRDRERQQQGLMESYTAGPVVAELNKSTLCSLGDTTSLELVPFTSYHRKQGDDESQKHKDEELSSDNRVLGPRGFLMELVRFAAAIEREPCVSYSSCLRFQQLVSKIVLSDMTLSPNWNLFSNLETTQTDLCMFVWSLRQLLLSDVPVLDVTVGQLFNAMKRVGFFNSNISGVSQPNLTSMSGLCLNSRTTVLLCGESSSSQGQNWQDSFVKKSRKDLVICKPLWLNSDAMLRAKFNLEANAIFQVTLKKGSHSGNGLFKRYDTLQTSFSSVLHLMEQSTAVPGSNPGWNVSLVRCIPTHASKRGAAASPWKVVLSLEQNGSSFEIASGSCMVDCFRLSGLVKEKLNWNSEFQSGFSNSPHFFVDRLPTNISQRRLHLVEIEALTDGEVAVAKQVDTCLVNGRVSRDPGSSLERNIDRATKKKYLRTLKGLKHNLSEFDVVGAGNDDLTDADSEDLGAGIEHPPLAKMAKIETHSKDVLLTFPQSSEREPHARLGLPILQDSAILEKMDDLGGRSPVGDYEVPFDFTETENSLNHSVSMEQNHASQSLASLSDQTNIGGVDFDVQANGGQLFDLELKEPCSESREPFSYNEKLDSRKRRREVVSSVYLAYAGASHLQSKRIMKRGRPSRQSKHDRNAEPTSCCFANLLITEYDRCWREFHSTVEFKVFNGKGWMIAVKSTGGCLYTHKVQQNTPTGSSNRFTHAMMWKGDSGWTLEFSDRKQWNAFKGLYEECGFRNARAASSKHIPIPGVRLIPDSEGLQSSGFMRPQSHYIYQPEDEIGLAHRSSHIFYDMDSEDEIWLDCINVEKSNIEDCKSKPWISEETFQEIIDKLEKSSFEWHHNPVSEDMALELCQGMGSTDLIKAIHAHWLGKRQKKGMALVRQFQPAPWERYRKQVQDWQAKQNELLLGSFTSMTQQSPHEYVRPPMFAFCLPPRGLELNNSKNKLQKQRSQRKPSSGCRLFWQGDSLPFEVSSDSNVIQQDRSRQMDKMLGPKPSSGLKLPEEALPESLCMKLAESSVDTQTCSSGGTGGITLLDQPESSEQSFGKVIVDGRRPRHKKMCRKAKGIGKSVGANEYRRKCILTGKQHYVHLAEDPDWHPTSERRSLTLSGHKVNRSHPTWQASALQNEVLECSDTGFRLQQSVLLDPLTKVAQAQEKAALARDSAAVKGERLHKLYLKFDYALRKAVAALIQLEAIQAVEQAACEHDPGSPSIASEGLKLLKQRVDVLSNQFSGGLGTQGQLMHGIRGGEVPQNFGSWPVYCEINEGFNGNHAHKNLEIKEAHSKQGLLSDADGTLLPVATWSQELDAGLGSTLLQRVDKRDGLSEVVV